MNINRLPGPTPDPKAKLESAGPSAPPANQAPARPDPGQPAVRTQDRVDAMPKGEAVPCLSLGESDELQVDYHKNGKIEVRGFQAGNPPALKDILAAAFPHAKKIEVNRSEHRHPFSTDFVTVDGKPFTASFLSGGFMPSKEYNIVPGHSKDPFTPDDLDHTEIRPGTHPKYDKLEPILKPFPGTNPVPDPILKPFPGTDRIPDPDLKPFPGTESRPLQAKHQPDGTIVVKGFAPGNPPPVEDVIKAAFPKAKNIEILSSSHQRPFDTYEVLVDGKPFTANFLFGGVVASNQFTIRPGHGKDLLA